MYADTSEKYGSVPGNVPQTRHGDELSLAVASGLVFVLASLCYANALPADFVFDDTAAIEGNPDITAGSEMCASPGPRPPRIPPPPPAQARRHTTAVLVRPCRSSLFRNDFWGTPIGSSYSHQSYRPLTVLTFRLDHEVAGLSRVQFHASNVFFHAVASALFVAFCRKTAFRERNAPRPSVCFVCEVC